MKRKLGFVETSMNVSQKHFNGTTQVGYCIEITTILEKLLFDKALQFSFTNIESLRLVIDSNNNEFVSSCEFENIEIGYYEKIGNDQSFEKYVEQEIDSSLSLWKAKCVIDNDNSSSSIMIVMNHSIIDASSFNFIANYILDKIDELISNIAKSFEVFDHPVPIDNFLFKSVSNKVSQSYDQIEYSECVPIDDRSSLTKTITIPSKILELAANEIGVTTNTLLVSMFGKVLGRKKQAIKTAVSIRDCLNLNTEKLGCYIGVATSILDCNESINGMADKYDHSLKKDLLTNVLNRVDIGYSDLVSAIMKKDRNNTFVDGIGITNMGAVSIGSGFSGFRITSFDVHVNRLMGNAEFVLHIHEFGGVSFIKIISVCPLIKKERFYLQTKEYEANLNRFVKKHEETEALEF